MIDIIQVWELKFQYPTYRSAGLVQMRVGVWGIQYKDTEPCCKDGAIIYINPVSLNKPVIDKGWSEVPIYY